MAAQAPAPIVDCAPLFAAQPADRATANCVYKLARQEGEAGPVTGFLERLALERSDLPWFSFYLGNLRWSDAVVAEEHYRRASELFARQGIDDGEVFSRMNRSLLLGRLGRTQEARFEVDRVLDITRASQDPELRVWGPVALARFLFDRGEDLERVYALLKGLNVPDSMEDAFSLRKERLSRLGSVCMAIGRFAEARAAFQQLAELATESGDRYLEADARYNRAWVAYETLRDAPTAARRAETLELAREALAASSVAGHVSAEALASWILGVLEPGEKGRGYLEDCVRTAQDIGIRSHCLNSLAVKVVATDPAAGWSFLERSRKLVEGSDDEWAVVRIWEVSMQLEWQTKAPPEALDSCWHALDAIELLRDRQAPGSPVQAGVFSLWSDDYAWLAGKLLSHARTATDPSWAEAEAFRVDERMRARALTDWLRATEAEASGAPAGGAFPDLEAAREALAPDEALLSFQVAPWEDLSGDFGGGSWVMVITRGGVTVHRLPGRVEVRRDVQIFEGLVEARNGADAGPAARLYEKLLAPALADLPASVTRLVLVPDDALHRLPFAALRASADAPPLGARFELVQVPSATLWLDWRREREAAPARPLLVLADPDVAAGEAAPGPAPVQVAQVRDAAAGLGRLPHARAEGRAAVRALGDGLLLMGPDASEAQVATLPLGDFGLVHFAAHAVTDEDRPERSAVLLAPGRGDYDGRLESAEIAGLHLDGRTVVLASCRSASGSVLRGEGVMSLARAFFQAGAHGVVASLWPLRDDESEALFGRFYRHLANGESVAAALHAARTEAIAAGEPAAAWAGLVVLGDGSVVPVPGGRAASPWTWAASAGLALLLAAAVAAGAVAARRSRARRA